MKYRYPVKYKGIFYPVGAEVPAEEETGTEGTKTPNTEADKKTKQTAK